MGKLAVVFPGQGSQVVGMAQELALAYPFVAAVVRAADDALGEPLSQLMFHGPDEQLRQTANTQPAILTASVAAYQLLAEAGIQPDVVAGHSLGEYSALVAAGSLAFTDAVRLVRLRGQLMEEAVPAGTGTMAAILGIDESVVRDICRQAQAVGVVEPATLNGPGQIVVAGQVEAVQMACELAKQAGARRVQPLNVSGPFHSSLLAPAGEKLQVALDQVRVEAPRIPVIANVSADYVTTVAEVKGALVRQVSASVRWEETVRRMVDDGIDTFIEVGPGRVLSGLIRRIAPKEAVVLNVEDQASWEKVVAHRKGDGVI